MWDTSSTGFGSVLAGLQVNPAKSVYVEPMGAGQNDRAALYTAELTVSFQGSKSGADALAFPNSQSCSQVLGPHSCPGSSGGTWVWNVEISAKVTGGAPSWIPKQKFQVYLISGEWKDSGGNLHPFGTLNNSYLQDPIDPAYRQRLPGMDTVFWLDSPGSRYYNDYPTDMEKIDSLTQIENFTSTVCSPYQLCPNIDWHLKLVVDPGGQLDLQQTQASLSHSAN